MVESTSISLHSLLDVFGDCEKQFDNELTNNGRKPKRTLIKIYGVALFMNCKLILLNLLKWCIRIYIETEYIYKILIFLRIMSLNKIFWS